MQPTEVRRLLEDRGAANDWFKGASVENPRDAAASLQRLADVGIPDDLLAIMLAQLRDQLPKLADGRMAINNLERFLAASRSPLSDAALFERDANALPTLLQMLAASQYLSDLLVTDPGAYELLRRTQGQPVSRELLTDEICEEVRSLGDSSAVMAALRRYKRRETLRIAYGDIVREQPIETVARQISYLADAIVEAAFRHAVEKLIAKHGRPQRSNGDPSECAILALGKLGGEELNYSSDIDLIFVFSGDGQTDGPRAPTNQEFFERLAREMVKLLGETTDLGFAYRVDLRLRPNGAVGPAAISYDAAVTYYDNKGRTWERQAFIKARAIAGSKDLGSRLLRRLEPWIYRRFLSRADITGIKNLKRRIEQNAESRGEEQTDIKTGLGGIRDIEFVIQFLQLINGSDLSEVRTGNTLDAITQLEQAGCLTPHERTLLEPNYQFLRKIEHRLQIMCDLQTHSLPETDAELARLAVRMGYVQPSLDAARVAFEKDIAECTENNRKILDHLLHDAFGGEPEQEAEVDLVNDPDPPPERIEAVLAPHGFADVRTAYTNLMALAKEPIRFLSTRRCRHFLASIAPRLLAAIADTPDPDATLVNLSRISDSLGGKAALWELFSVNRPSMNLYVTLCAACPYLASILTSNPGMIDELVDSLSMDKLPSPEMLQRELAELTHNAEDVDPILHSFKAAQHLRVGVRDILGKDEIRATHRALADIAEACVRQVTAIEKERLIEKFGTPLLKAPKETDLPMIADFRAKHGDRTGEPCELIILAMGKLGGQEPNYHSDLDLVFLFEGEGHTEHENSQGKSTTTNAHFYSELGQRIIKRIGQIGPHGQLFEVDMRLRPTGRSGALALPVEAFLKYFASGKGQLWERQALCKARVVWGSLRAANRVMDAVHSAMFHGPWQPKCAVDIREMRIRLQENASLRNLKRGPGGTVDTEFLVQMLQLKYGQAEPDLRVPGTLAALESLHRAGHLTDDDAEYFSRSYQFQRSVEARIRLMNAIGRHELPEDETELAKLAFLLGYSNPQKLEDDALNYFAENRERFDRLFDEHK